MVSRCLLSAGPVNLPKVSASQHLWSGLSTRSTASLHRIHPVLLKRDAVTDWCSDQELIFIGVREKKEREKRERDRQRERACHHTLTSGEGNEIGVNSVGSPIWAQRVSFKSQCGTLTLSGAITILVRLHLHLQGYLGKPQGGAAGGNCGQGEVSDGWTYRPWTHTHTHTHTHTPAAVSVWGPCSHR